MKTKTRYVDLNVNEGNFVSRFISGKKEHDFSDVSMLRKILSNQKARILSELKNQNPSSIYELAKKLNRDFKSVRNDLKLLERFGFIEFQSNSKGKRTSLRPVLSAEQLQIMINI